MEYITVEEAAEKWGLSERRIQFLCKKGAIQGVAKLGANWIIPRNAEMPDDGQPKRPAQSMPVSVNNEAILAKIIEGFPYPIHVYAPDGTLVLTNEICLKVMHIPSKDMIVGKFNVLNDPIIDIWEEGTRERIKKSFQGETVHFQDIVMPIQNILRRFESNEACFEISFQNITCFPVYDDNNQLAYVVHVFITSKKYNNEEKVLKAKEYMENNWLEAFDLDKIAQVVNLSKHHFARLFKKDTAVTPFKYYQEIKIGKLKEVLCNTSHSISEAFSSCGLDYNGNYAKVFKERVGMTPSQYRKMVGQK